MTVARRGRMFDGNRLRPSRLDSKQLNVATLVACEWGHPKHTDVLVDAVRELIQRQRRG
jgi:hypothetical protein